MNISDFFFSNTSSSVDQYQILSFTPILKHPQCTFLHLSERPSFIPYKITRRINLFHINVKYYVSGGKQKSFKRGARNHSAPNIAINEFSVATDIHQKK
jgi:hypothetical protein